ncbi:MULTISPECIES: hypothetical protein [Catenuloplanes]|uniref:PIN domain-containing protein n=1 Tax=Catenuloplanes niger TaxID=587534 RepID=A0AAE3ZLZ4_9ACTN|nr:hypothetical protein [Catenuloplanes niger]MDR7320588.1 hypothetical protein [Catenuloplanes niger]
MDLVDTMIVSYAWKGIPGFEIQGRSISSVTAQEFLLVQTPDPKQPLYYLPSRGLLVVGRHHLVVRAGNRISPAQRERLRRKWKDQTDRLIIDFASDYPRIVEYGHNRISGTINAKDITYYSACTSVLDRQIQDTLLSRFAFLAANGVRCIALSPRIIEQMFTLLEAFSQTANVKTNFRNSINDLLILATAIDRRVRLVTRDTLLNRFAAGVHDAPVERVAPEVWTIDFSESTADRRKPYESKGYVNRSWQVMERRT